MGICKVEVSKGRLGKGDGNMAKFYIAGCFADNIIVDNDKDRIEKRAGGPAYFIKNTLDALGENYEVAKGKRGIVEIHVHGKKEIGRFPRACKLSFAPITSKIVLAYAISNELCLDSLKGNYEEIYMDAKGFVRDPEKFGKQRKCGIKNVERVKVLKATPSEIEFLPENLLSQVRENGILLVTEPSCVTLIERGDESRFIVKEVSAPQSVGMEETFFAAFSSEYSKNKEAKKAVEFAIAHAREFTSREEKVADEE